MSENANKAIAIVGVGAILPDAPNAATYWRNLSEGRYCIKEVPSGRWDPELYFDSDHSAPDKTYSRIGGWVTDFDWQPLKWRLPIPPKVDQAMDLTQRWAICAAREALADYGYPDRPLDTERTAVVLGNALSGDTHYRTAARIMFPEFGMHLRGSQSFKALPTATQNAIYEEMHRGVSDAFPTITEDTMPGELANIIAGRIASLYNFHGPNFVTDAACASAMAAIMAASEGLLEGQFDTVITGGVDGNMGIQAFTKFCKIGALSATGTRPYHDGADGFVMGEGAAVFILKRLADAEAAGDRIYALVRGVGGSSDGKGKGITAPNPIGQQLAVQRAWADAGLSPASASYIEGHGTSTKVGDVVEVQALAEVFSKAGLSGRKIPLGSVKSNIGHLKGAAGAAGILKTALMLKERKLVPSLGGDRLNPNLDWSTVPFEVNHELRDWEDAPDGVRRAGVSAFGFGGTNFHVVLEEHIPGRLKVSTIGDAERGKKMGSTTTSSVSSAPEFSDAKVPMRGALVLGGSDLASLKSQLAAVVREASSGSAPDAEAPSYAALNSPMRLAIDYGDAAELAKKGTQALKAIDANQRKVWKALRSQGIFLGKGPAAKVAFLYPGQGSQYLHMLKSLRDRDGVVRNTFREADDTMRPILGKDLTAFIYPDAKSEEELKAADRELRQTAITQPAMLACNEAISRLMATYGVKADMVMGHSLGEYAALVASSGLPFAHALEAVAARGAEMTKVSVEDNGLMAAAFAPLDTLEEVLKSVDGYVVIANYNSSAQAVIGGETQPMQQAMAELQKRGFKVVQLPVSHAFHTRIVAPASEPLTRVLKRLSLRGPTIPLIANVTGEPYPMGDDVNDAMVEMLGKQIASPVQFKKGLETLYAAGARIFVEIGPKRALFGLVDDVLGDKDDVSILFTNHARIDDATAFNQALCGLYAAGVGATSTATSTEAEPRAEVRAIAPVKAAAPLPTATPAPARRQASGDVYQQLGAMFADVLERGMDLLHHGPGDGDGRSGKNVVVTGAGLGLPGTERVFDDDQVLRILRGDQLIDAIPLKFRDEMAQKRITRLVKKEAGEPHFETIDDADEVVKLAGRGGQLELDREFGFPEERLSALGRQTQLAIAVGLEALRDAGIPLVMHYKTTTRGTKLPERWMLPESMRDDTGVIYGCAFPGHDALAKELQDYHAYDVRRQKLAELEQLHQRLSAKGGDPVTLNEISVRIDDLRRDMQDHPFELDRRFLFRILPMGNGQLAEYIGARGPNTQLNSACATGTQSVAIAEDWIKQGRCKRVIVVTADDASGDNLVDWIGSGFLASGAAATDARVEDAAMPFDRRRHGMLMGMGAAGWVIESEEAAAERGVRPICEVLGTKTVNSAFHGTRLDIEHICDVMEDLVSDVERRSGLSRADIAPRMMFMSHETYTPARGGSAQAEISALRRVFGPNADQVVIANTKGFTGHAMGAGVEDVVAIKALETGMVPPVANHKEIDPELGALNLSRGGAYPIQFALRLAAGFGSQLSMSLTRWSETPDGVRQSPHALGAAYRTERPVYQAWLDASTGYDGARTELVGRSLRVVDAGAPTREPARLAGREGTVAAPVITKPAAPEPATVPTAPAVAAPPPVAKPATVAPVPAAPPAPAPPPATEPATAAASPKDAIGTKVMEIVAAQTGYPPDMLELDLDLEADLGVDTVKQAQTFAAVREAFDIPREDTLQLRDFPTLRHVVGFVLDRKPDLASAAPAAAPSAPAPVAAATPPSGDAGSDRSAIENRVMEIVSAQTGYPADMLELDLDLEADLGVDTVKQAQTFAAVREAFDIPRDDNLQLRDFPTMRHVVGFVLDKRPDLAAEPAAPAAAPAAAPTFTPIVATPAAPAAAAAAPAAGDAAILQSVMEVVAEKTGYPVDMLEGGLDLEADLGVDTVKQAEMFAGVRERFDIPRDESLQLRDFPTIDSVVEFVKARSPKVAAEAAAAPVVPAAAPAAVAPASGDAAILQAVMEVVSEKTGYPVDMLEGGLDLEADLGVDTVKQAEMFAGVRERYDIPRDESLQLRDFPTIDSVVEFVKARSPAVAAEAAAAPMVPAAAPTPAAGTPDDASNDGDAAILRAVMEVVSEKTGYPVDMLEGGLDLEADLGVDTVKQAEMFAGVRERYDIPRDESLQLRDFPTIDSVVEFVKARSPEMAAPATEAAQAPEAIPSASVSDETGLRRGPAAVLRPPLSVFKNTDVVLDETARVIVVLDRGGVGSALVDRLEKRGVRVLAINDHPSVDELVETVVAFDGEEPITGLFWLRALDDEGDLSALEPDAFAEQARLRVKDLYAVSRTLYERFQGGAFLTAATRLGGQHGYGDEGATAPMGGAVVGFSKALKRECPEAPVKAVDFPKSRKKAALADQLLEETLHDPGVVEIGRREDERWTVGLMEKPLDAQEPVNLEDPVYVITGGAGSIVSAIVTDLAKTLPGTFYLLDLAPEPDPEDADLKQFAEDKEGLKRTIFERLKAAGEKATPVRVERELAGLERQHAALEAMSAVRAAGGAVHYRSGNLLDADYVDRVIGEIRGAHRRIDVLMHAGGIEISKNLPDKPPEEFELVFDIKALGMYHLLRAIGDTPLGASIVFSSIAGRFGNMGQADYSAANDFLCKVNSSLRRTHPETRAISLDWTAWADIGMASRGSIPAIMEAAGIDMLPPQIGIPVSRRELTHPDGGGELVVAGRLGILLEELDETGGLDPEKVSASRGLMVERPVSISLVDGLTVETVLDPKEQAFLYDHQIDGVPVLPGVMGLEAFAEHSQLLFPDLQVTGFEDVRFLAPFKFYRHEPRTVRIQACFTREGDAVVANCELIGERTIKGLSEPQRTTHFKARVLLNGERSQATIQVPKLVDNGRKVENAAIYEIYFHGPAYQVLQEAWRDGDDVVGRFATELPDDHAPADPPFLVSPRLIELAFQTAGVWEIGATGHMGLPARIDRVKVHGAASNGETCAVVHRHGEEGFDAEVVDSDGNVVVSLEGYATIALPGTVDDQKRAPLAEAVD